MSTFKVQQIDHVEMNVSDLRKAATWHKRVFGLDVVDDTWEAQGGPLFLSSDNGSTNLALFIGEPPANDPPASNFRVAFRTDADGFMTFVERVASLNLRNHTGETLIGRENVVDHDRSWSIYFADPYGNRFEITTYDYDVVKHNIG